MIILGLDPGSRITGYGLIDNQPGRMSYIHSGHIRVQGDNISERLGYIFQQVSAVIEQYQPQQMGIENVFMSRNADSALKLGQARGAAICAAHQAGLGVAEYAPKEIKKFIVGKGAASKEQVQHMVRHLLLLTHKLQADEADGLAIAICHAQFSTMAQKTGLALKSLKHRRSSMR